jgi:BirA family biotin operon repressor/biotin-[acetyl-CoA-carboxylase] ligase
MVLRPQMQTENVSMLTLVAALATARALEYKGVYEKQTACIKWPNDLVLHKKKICGILTELVLEGTTIDYVIIGIGINVSNQVFPEEIKETASSILLETGKNMDRESIIEEVWKCFEKDYERFLQNQDLSLLKEEYETYLVNKHQKVNVLDPAGNYEGTAIGITNKGELVVDTGKETRLVSSGEVSVRGIYGYV